MTELKTKELVLAGSRGFSSTEIPPFWTGCSATTIGNTIHRFRTAPLRSKRSWENFRLISNMSQASS